MRPRHWLYTIPLRTRSLFNRSAADIDLDEELQFHLEQKTQQFIASGLSEKDARYAALREFRSLQQSKENCRDQRKINWLQDLVQDLRFGARMLRKNPGFTTIAIFTLALGIGANTIVFSVVNAALLRPLPFAHPNQLVDLYSKTKPSDQSFALYSSFLFWQREARSIQTMAAWTDDSFDLTGMGDAERLNGRKTSADFFTVFGVQSILGRTFREQDNQIGAAPVVLVSERFWKSTLGASPSAIGKNLTLNQTRYEIIGVIPSSFRLWNAVDVFIPAGLSENPSPNYRGPGTVYAVTGRLKPGVTLTQVRTDMDRVFRDYAADYPDAVYGALGISAYSLKQDVIGDLQPTLLLLLGAVGFVLLIACANIANLLLARSTGRTREFAVRTALGASRTRVIRQLLTENLLLYCGGASAGIFIAGWGTRFVVKFFPTVLPGMLPVDLDIRVLAFALAASAFTGMLFGLLPALKSSNPNLQETLKAGRQGERSGRHRTQSILVVAEISLALVLLIGAGLMVRTMHRIWKVNPGFNPSGVIVFSISFPPQSKIDSEAMYARNRELVANLAALPGVESASVGQVPMISDGWTPYWPDGQPPRKKTSDMYDATYFAVGPDYFRSMGIPIRRGRVFTNRDNHSAPMVIVVDENLARRLFPGQDPLGKRLNMVGFGSAVIVGVVQHVKQFGLIDDSKAKLQDQIYQPFDQLPGQLTPVIAGEVGVVMRTSVAPANLLAAIRATINKTDSECAVYGLRLMEDVVRDSQRGRHFETILLGAFGVIALLLASVGIYGVVSHLAAQRTHEIGIRIALGAQRGDILRIVVGQAGKMALTGIAVGIAASFGLTRLIANRLFGLSSTDPFTFAAVAAALVCVTLAASYIPARRATRVDPMVALRNE